MEQKSLQLSYGMCWSMQFIGRKKKWRKFAFDTTETSIVERNKNWNRFTNKIYWIFWIYFVEKNVTMNSEVCRWKFFFFYYELKLRFLRVMTKAVKQWKSGEKNTTGFYIALIMDFLIVTLLLHHKFQLQ